MKTIHERERDYLTRTRKSPTVRIKINFSANAKCQSRARRREKSPAFFDHCTPDDNSALAIWKIPGISCLLGLQNPPQFFSLSLVDIWDNFYMHDLQLTIGTICKACESSEGSSIDRNLLVYSSGKVSLNALKATEQIYFSLFRRKSPFKNAWCDAGKGGAEPQAIFSHSTIRVAPHRGLFMGPHTKKNQSIQIWSFFHFPSGFLIWNVFHRQLCAR